MQPLLCVVPILNRPSEQRPQYSTQINIFQYEQINNVKRINHDKTPLLHMHCTHGFVTQLDTSMSTAVFLVSHLVNNYKKAMPKILQCLQQTFLCTVMNSTLCQHPAPSQVFSMSISTLALTKYLHTALHMECSRDKYLQACGR